MRRCLLVGVGLEPRDLLDAALELRVGLGQLALGKLVLRRAPALTLVVDLAAGVGARGGLLGRAVADGLRDLLLRAAALLLRRGGLLGLLGSHAGSGVLGGGAQLGTALFAGEDR